MIDLHCPWRLGYGPGVAALGLTFNLLSIEAVFGYIYFASIARYIVRFSFQNGLSELAISLLLVPSSIMPDHLPSSSPQVVCCASRFVPVQAIIYLDA